MFGVLGHRRSGNVDVCAAGALVGENHPDFFHHRLVFGFGGFEQAGCVVSVGQCHTAFTGGHGLDLVCIATFGCACHVGHHTFEPGFALFIAQAFDHGGKQRHVVGV